MRTARSLPYGGVFLTETPLDRDSHLDRDPHGQKPPRCRLPWTETPSGTETRVPTRLGKPWKMRVHLKNLEISWNFEKFNKNHETWKKTGWVIKFPPNPLKYLNHLEGRFINLEYNWNGQFLIQMKIGKFVDVNQNNLEITLKIMKKYLEIYWKTWKNHGKVMEFCKSEKVGTLTPSWTETPMDRDPLGQRPPGQRPPPRQRPP